MGIGTQALLKARIALELSRPDILSNDGRIADAITDAITQYQKEKFRFSEIDNTAPPTFNTVNGTWAYTAAATGQPVISNNFCINFLTYLYGTSVFFIRRTTPLAIIMANQNTNVFGPPEAFAYEGEELLLTPIPDQAYQITIDAHLLVAAPASDTTTGNRWMTDGEMLIRSRVKFEIATHITRNPVMAQAMSPDETGGPNGGPGATYRAWRALKGEGNRLTGTGRISPMLF